MKIRNLTIVLSTALLFTCCSISLVQGAGFTSLGDCLVTNDVGRFNFESQSARIGDGSGVVAMAGHFNRDHSDTVCSGEYSNISEIRGLPINEVRNKILGVEVQVTKHSGSDSDKWLQHELDTEFRNYYGIPGNSYAVVPIDGKYVLEFGSAGWDYRWMSGAKVIKIEYHDSQMTKPEPLEVVKAYLAKHPSTIPPMTLSELRSVENKTKWIKDEMDRRLWLSDKWFYQLQLKKVEKKQVYQEAVKSMNVFLDYREKYFGIKAADEKNLLAGYLMQNNGTGIKTELDEYKKWWAVNKKGISL